MIRYISYIIVANAKVYSMSTQYLFTKCRRNMCLISVLFFSKYDCDMNIFYIVV